MNSYIGENSDGPRNNKPPCSAAMVAFWGFRCGLQVLFVRNELNVFENALDCLIKNGFMKISQSCIACLVNSDINSFAFCTAKGGRTTSMNIPGLILLSKHPIIRVKTVYYEPNVKLIFPRVFLQAEVKLFIVMMFKLLSY